VRTLCEAGAVALFVAVCLIAAPLATGEAAPGATAQAANEGFSSQVVLSWDDIPIELFIQGWITSDEPQRFPGQSLFGHINGGAELFLEYGFRELVVFRFTPLGGRLDREIVLEVYAMESAREAFGIFSLKRTGAEPTSDRQRALNWVEVEQAAFVLGSLYVNILAANCTIDETAGFAAGAEVALSAGRAVPEAGFTGLPAGGLMPGTERFIKGAVAASAESPFLAPEFWGFADRGTLAWSARYVPGGAKLILVEYGGETGDFLPPVASLFREYFEDVAEEGGGVVSARTPEGRLMLYGRRDGRAVFILSESDEKAGRARLAEALEKSVIAWRSQ